MGDAPRRLGVPDACGFLWEEAARGHSAQLVAQEAQEGEIPPPLSGLLILPLPQGPNTGDPLDIPRIRQYGADATQGTRFRALRPARLPRSNFHLLTPS